jgi:hypothetical protein
MRAAPVSADPSSKPLMFRNLAIAGTIISHISGRAPVARVFPGIFATVALVMLERQGSVASRW